MDGDLGAQLDSIEIEVPEAEIYYKNEKIIFKIDLKYYALGSVAPKGEIKVDLFGNTHYEGEGWLCHFPVTCLKENASYWWKNFKEENWEEFPVHDEDKNSVVLEGVTTLNPDDLLVFDGVSSASPSSILHLEGQDGKVEIHNDGTITYEDDDEEHTINIMDIINLVKDKKDST